eukprot:1151538-Pelagomonas_calceolata.AAC.3
MHSRPMHVPHTLAMQSGRKLTPITHSMLQAVSAHTSGRQACCMVTETQQTHGKALFNTAQNARIHFEFAHYQCAHWLSFERHATRSPFETILNPDPH